MTDSFATMFRLTTRGSAGLACDERGVALGPIALVDALSSNGGCVYRARPAEEIARALALAYGPFSADDLARRLFSLDVAARALEAGNLAKAGIATVLLKLPPLTAEAFAKLAQDPTLRKYSPDQPRDERGRWTSGPNAPSVSNGGASLIARPVQLASNDTGVMSDAGGSLPTAGDQRDDNHAILRDGTVVRNNKGEPMRKPPGVSLEENARIGQALAEEERRAAAEAQQGVVNLDDRIMSPKDAAMIALFWPDLGSMDYQRKFGVSGKINRGYIDFGNYNYGVVAAAAGYSWDYATTASGLANLLGSGKKSLQDRFNNPDNLKMIRQGFDDYRAGKIIPLKN